MEGRTEVTSLYPMGGRVKTRTFLVPGLQGRPVAPCRVSSVSFLGAPTVKGGLQLTEGDTGQWQ